MASTLNGFVTSVVCDVVLFVGLEEVAGTHRVAALQKSLQHSHCGERDGVRKTENGVSGANTHCH